MTFKRFVILHHFHNKLSDLIYRDFTLLTYHFYNSFFIFFISFDRDMYSTRYLTIKKFSDNELKW